MRKKIGSRWTKPPAEFSVDSGSIGTFVALATVVGRIGIVLQVPEEIRLRVETVGIRNDANRLEHGHREFERHQIARLGDPVAIDQSNVEHIVRILDRNPHLVALKAQQNACQHSPILEVDQHKLYFVPATMMR